MNNSLWFDESVYLKNKAAQCGLSETDTLNAIHNEGMDLFTHYARYGEAEGVNPNELFNPVQYARAVAQSWNDTAYKGFSGWGEADVLALVQGFGVTLYDHFSQVGWLQNLNASNGFDVSAYMQNKAAAVGLSVADTVAAFVAAGVDAVSHFMAWGSNENIPVTTVPLEEAVRPASGFNAAPTDPLFNQQWHLQNTGQNGYGYVPGIDLNVLPAWQAYTGEGVSVAVVDQGVEFDHPDLAKNINPSCSFGADGGDGQPVWRNSFDENGEPLYGDNQGTSCAGVIAAEADNGTGCAGIAFEAELVSVRVNIYDDTEDFDLPFFEALTKGFDVLSCSWSLRYGLQIDKPQSVADYVEQFSPATVALDAGRDGKGEIFCIVAGNDYVPRHDPVGDLFLSLPEAIVVGAVGPNGQVASYSSEFAGVLVSAPSQTLLFNAPGDITYPGGIVTTDRQGEEGYNTKPSPEGDNFFEFAGTSATCPQVASVAALMLEANANLGWRDVQSILALTARNTDPTDPRWVENTAENWNGGGLSHHRQMGFGLVDATAAVRLAETWTEQNTSANQSVVSATTSVEAMVPNATGHALASSLSINDSIDVENVVVHVRLEHGYAPDLELRLTSPSGTTLTIYDEVLTLNSLPLADENGNLIYEAHNLDLGGLTSIKATGFRGEDSQGVWTLEVWDIEGNRRVGTLHDWTMELHGKAESADDTYIYTNDFARLAADSARTVLADAEGYNTINTAAVSSEVYVDMRAGQNGLWITGAHLALAEGTAIQRVFTGDAKDTVVTNSLGNSIDTGRGNDLVIVSGPGNNVINGGAGLNAVQFFGNRADYNVQLVEGHYVVADQDGVNELYNVQTIQFADQTVQMDFMTQFA